LLHHRLFLGLFLGPVPCPIHKTAVTNPDVTNPFPGTLQLKKSTRCDLLHRRSGPPALNRGMAEKTYQSSFDPQRDVGTDYALIATGIGTALIALIYLILI
jgi:hypothetical protein